MRIMQSLATLIDNIFVDGQLLKDCLADVLINDGSDHFMLIGKLDILNIRPPKNKLKYRDLSENSLRKLAENLDQVDFSNVFRSKCANEAYN